jgi:hypothetical protein
MEKPGVGSPFHGGGGAGGGGGGSAPTQVLVGPSYTVPGPHSAAPLTAGDTRPPYDIDNIPIPSTSAILVIRAVISAPFELVPADADPYFTTVSGDRHG